MQKSESQIHFERCNVLVAVVRGRLGYAEVRFWLDPSRSEEPKFIVRIEGKHYTKEYFNDPSRVQREDWTAGIEPPCLTLSDALEIAKVKVS